LSGIFSTYANRLEERKEMGIKYGEIMEIISAKVDAIEDAETANEAAAWAKAYDGHVWDSLMQSSLRINAKAKEIGLTLNKQKKYEPAAVATAA
jgi:hypothetical protein